MHEAIVRNIQSAGIEVKEVRLPEIFDIQSAILMTIMRAEMASAHTEIHRNNSVSYKTKLRGLVETGMLLDAGSYLTARRLRRIYQNEMTQLFDGCDLLISLGAKDTAPEGLGYTGDPAFSGPWTLADLPQSPCLTAWLRTECPSPSNCRRRRCRNRCSFMAPESSKKSSVFRVRLRYLFNAGR